MKNEGIAIIIEDVDGRYLLHHRDELAPTMKNEWCLVGGVKDEGESPEEAVKRELKEETNLDAGSIDFFEKFVRNDKDVDILIYHTKTDSRKNRIILGEGRELKFFECEEILKLIDSIENPNQYLQSMKKYILR